MDRQPARVRPGPRLLLPVRASGPNDAQRPFAMTVKQWTAACDAIRAESNKHLPAIVQILTILKVSPDTAQTAAEEILTEIFPCPTYPTVKRKHKPQWKLAKQRKERIRSERTN